MIQDRSGRSGGARRFPPAPPDYLRAACVARAAPALGTGMALWAGLVLLALLAAPPLRAQESASPVRRISPDEAVDLAVKSNLSLESARVAAGTKKRNSDLSWNQFIPSVTLGGSLMLDNVKTSASGMQPVDLAELGKMINMPIPEKTVYGVYPYSMDALQWHIAGSLQMSLTISAAMFENMRRLRLDYQGGLLSYDKARVQVERDIRKSYNSMLLLIQNIALLRENFEAARKRVETAQANYRAGLAPELTVLQAQVSMENLKPNIDNAENGLKLSKAQFAMNLGLPYDTEFELIPLEGELSLVTLDAAALISQAAAGKPDIMELRHNLLLLQSARKAQLLSLTPSLTLSWGATPAFIRDPWKDDWGNSDYWQDSGRLTISLGLRLHSLLPWSTDNQGIKDIEDSIRAANIGLSQLIRGTEVEIYNIVLDLEKTRITAEAQAQTIDLAERSYRLTEEAYRAGLQDRLEVENAELSLRQARVQMLEQQFNYLNRLIDLEYSAGVPFGTLSGSSGAAAGGE